MTYFGPITGERRDARSAAPPPAAPPSGPSRTPAASSRRRSCLALAFFLFFVILVVLLFSSVGAAWTSAVHCGCWSISASRDGRGHRAAAVRRGAQRSARLVAADSATVGESVKVLRRLERIGVPATGRRVRSTGVQRSARSGNRPIHASQLSLSTATQNIDRYCIDVDASPSPPAEEALRSRLSIRSWRPAWSAGSFPFCTQPRSVFSETRATLPPRAPSTTGAPTAPPPPAQPRVDHAGPVPREPRRGPHRGRSVATARRSSARSSGPALPTLAGWIGVAIRAATPVVPLAVAPGIDRHSIGNDAGTAPPNRFTGSGRFVSPSA